ncbi:TIR domain-containing protein [Rhizobium ruizarguesonis]
MTTYVIFDGDTDRWAYRFVRGWHSNPNIPFTFADAHDLDNMTSRAQSEDYVKGRLRERMKQSTAVLALIGESTKNLYRFVRWELELAMSLDLPIIAANLNDSRTQDALCPPVIRDRCVVHVPFKLKAIEHALTHWPVEYRSLSREERSGGARHYTQGQYREWGL